MATHLLHHGAAKRHGLAMSLCVRVSNLEGLPALACLLKKEGEFRIVADGAQRRVETRE